MHVLVITPVYPHPGSPAEGLFNEQHALALTRAGIQVSIVVCKPWLPNGLAKVWRRYNSLADLPEIQELDGIAIVYARYFHIPKYQLPHVTVASCSRSILQAVTRFNPREPFDLIQVHSSWPVGLAAPIIAKTLERPFVLTMHIQDEARLYARRRGFTLYRRMIEEASVVVAVGSVLERFAKERGMLAERRRLRVIPNGVDSVKLQEVLRGVSGKQNGWGNIISVANLWPVKGIDLNIQALARLAKEGTPWMTYTIVGDGPERPRLERLARDLCIANRITFTGRLPHQEALAEIAKADIFSLPSWQEAFGVAYLEAMACGKPAIGCRGQGAEDIIRNGRDGILVSPMNVGDLVEALKRLILDPEFARRLGESGMSRAKDFTWEKNVTQYMDIYRESCLEASSAESNINS